MHFGAQGLRRARGGQGPGPSGTGPRPEYRPWSGPSTGREEPPPSPRWGVRPSEYSRPAGCGGPLGTSSPAVLCFAEPRTGGRTARRGLRESVQSTTCRRRRAASGRYAAAYRRLRFRLENA
jgi:hypothetical protein